ncbi:MAG: recombinase family protein [Lachnospiraceae bacterium]|nr:recombinase family protein [Lachnospiraceae bacterium]
MEERKHTSGSVEVACRVRKRRGTAEKTAAEKRKLQASGTVGTAVQETVAKASETAAAKPVVQKKTVQNSVTVPLEENSAVEASATCDGKTRVAAYCRVSTMTDEQEGSIETQKQAYEKIIHENPDYELAGIYADRGISGGSTKKRVQFQKMMQDCRDGKVDLVLTKSISRFARNLADTLECIRELKELGIPVHFDREGIDTMDPSSDMLLGMLAAVAQEEINNLSQNVKWAYEKSNAKGNPRSTASYGYRKYMDGETCVWKICEPEARRIRLAFEMAERGEVIWKIVRALQEMEDREGTGIIWERSRLRDYLRDEVYIGNRVTGKYVIADCLQKKLVKNRGDHPMYYLEGHHEALVKKEQFERVQENLKNGVNTSPRDEDIPDRYRSEAWKFRHGKKEQNNNTAIFQGLRGCCSNKGKGALKNGEKCVYGRCRCHNCGKGS